MLIEQFICRIDNIAILLHHESSQRTIAIDAPDGEALLAHLQKLERKLDLVLITHHHTDHTSGIRVIKEKTNALFIGPEAEKSKIFGLDYVINEHDILQTDFCNIEVLSTPGHTLGSISYYFPEEKLIFTGDTLFSLGCGRIFEGSTKMMFHSLEKLASIPEDTRMYCGHEYTEKNGQFALTVDPQNKNLQDHVAKIISLRKKNRLTMPSTIGLERAINPFLRSANPSIRKNLDLMTASDERVFATLRKLKDNY
ncbi:MAG: hydroxyacylglutathione hydrolase [Candidatus Tokpelaia sp. JSC161]|jgi:hydroxyacylglutathione hydrolase|nr:MAG: hydroxyacylglutathione hydrolase [Candidatus Tokpelaia sp. JSC161]